jgi:hypothetical protein
MAPFETTKPKVAAEQITPNDVRSLQLSPPQQRTHRENELWMWFYVPLSHRSLATAQHGEIMQSKAEPMAGNQTALLTTQNLMLYILVYFPVNLVKVNKLS